MCKEFAVASGVAPEFGENPRLVPMSDKSYAHQQTQNWKPVAVAGVERFVRVPVVFQRYVFYQNTIRMGRGDNSARYSAERIDYAGDSSIGAAENGNAVFDRAEGRGG